MTAIEFVRSLAVEILQQDGFALETPVSYRGLSLVPIVCTEQTNRKVDYLNAVQALNENVLEITEAGDAVNTILAHNRGTIPILIEEAEVLVGQGSQDRIVVASIILQSGETARIPVKCVHAPHALRRGATFISGGHGSMGLKSQLRAKKYRSIMTDVEHYVPETAVDQQEVWEEVERYCSALGIQDITKYSDAMTKIQEKTKAIANDLRNLMPSELCGFVLINSKGEAIALEFYRNANAFLHREGVFESLLVEYGDAKGRSPSESEAEGIAKALLRELEDASEKTIFSKEGSDIITIGLGNLKGEAVSGRTRKGEKVLYCSLGI